MFHSRSLDHNQNQTRNIPARERGTRVAGHPSQVNLSYFAAILVVTLFSFCAVAPCRGQQNKKPFSVADDITFTQFGEHWTGQAEAIEFSPDGKYFAVCTQRGSLDLNRVHGSLRFYRTEEIEHFLQHPSESQAPSPIWVVDRSQSEGVPFRFWHWLGDSGGVAFLESETFLDVHALMLADLRKRTVERLSLANEDVREFDVYDKKNLLFTVADPAPLEQFEAERKSAATILTGRSVDLLLNPERVARSNYLLAVAGGKRFQVKTNGTPLVPQGFESFRISPDGHSLVTILAVPKVPASWEYLYPPAYPPSSYYFEYRIRAGGSANQYVQIDLQTGAVQPLTDAPVGDDAGWWGAASPSWSNDGQAILLPGTFLKSKENIPSRPCIAVVDLRSNTTSCVENLKGHTETGAREAGYHIANSVRFVDGDKSRVMVSYLNYEDESVAETTEYRQGSDGKWQVIGQKRVAVEGLHANLQVTVKQGLNEPPLLVAKSDKGISRVLWDPNPQLKNVELGEASTYTWKDKQGREQKAGLYKPREYKPGHRYPLVIQTHAFVEGIFAPSGAFSTAFAARALAASGIMVLQVGDVGNCPILTADEGACYAAGYELVANKLVSDGLVDPERIGIIGFSRTCFYVMEMLTKSALHPRAASITDGFMYTYLQYVLWPDRMDDEAKRTIGAAPFGEGLQEWLKKSPEFNLDKVNTAVLVVGEGPLSSLFMWQPYSGLHSLHKPTELVMLKDTHEHNLGNPAVRMASQGGSVDWFRFWLQDYEDPDPAKVQQYKRWRELKKMQRENEKSSATESNPANIN